jgi:hypothetical protein
MATVARARTGYGIVQMYALVFGIAYLAVAVLEVALGSNGLKLGGTTILQITPIQNLIHWAVGVAVLGSFFLARTRPSWSPAPWVACSCC